MVYFLVEILSNIFSSVWFIYCDGKYIFIVIIFIFFGYGFGLFGLGIVFDLKEEEK